MFPGAMLFREPVKVLAIRLHVLKLSQEVIRLAVRFPEGIVASPSSACRYSLRVEQAS